MNYAGKKALVLGLGESGLAMARWLACCGAFVRVADTRENPDRLAILKQEVPQAEFKGGAFAESLIDGMDIIAVSPGLRPNQDLAEIRWAAQKAGILLWSEIELFAQALTFLKQNHGYAPNIIAITGTNGKTTVTSLTGKMCANAGKTVKVAGNISPAVLDVLREALKANALPEVWVLELSSFQLWSTYSLNADVATVLNVTQDHLDWHDGMDDYAQAKQRIFGPSTIQLLNRNDDLVMKMGLPDHQVVTFGLDKPVREKDLGIHSHRGMDWLSFIRPQENHGLGNKKGEVSEEERIIQDLMPAKALRIQGRHNASNALAALGLCQAIKLPLAMLLHALKDYRGEPHRVEPVMSVSGVSYVDDSKGTNVGATVAAIEGLGFDKENGKKSLLLIAGGDGKDQDFSPLVAPVSKYVHTVLLIGKDAKIIEKALAGSDVNLVLCHSLEDAVNRAADRAKEGDIVLLSPACASMDMFKNYAHRAEVFISSVKEMALSRGEVAV